MIGNSHSQLCKKNCFSGTGILNFAKFLRTPFLQAFSCEFCEISKNTFFDRTSPVAASVLRRNTKHKKDEIVEANEADN